MKNFYLKNIALVLAVFLGTTAAYSSHDVDGDDLLGCSRKSGKHTSKPAPKPYCAVDEITHVNVCPWNLVIARNEATYRSGALVVKLRDCGRTEIDAHGCISQQMNKEIVQALSLAKTLFALDAKFNPDHLKSVLTRFEECPCPTRR